MSQKHIYVLISRTQTKFARCIRALGKVKYNHSSVALDENFEKLYAFSRPQHRAIFLGRLVRETLDRFLLNKNLVIPAVVFKIPVSAEKYDEICTHMNDIMCDDEYMYNLFSVMTYPFTHGFAVYKAFNCTEFAAYILEKIGFHLTKPLYQYKPDDFLTLLASYNHFEGDLKDFMVCKDTDALYYEPYNWNLIKRNFQGLRRIFKRTYIEKH